jgi:PAS domain S-box-containing protein
MSDQENIRHNQLTGQLSKTPLPFSIINRPVVLSVIVFLLLTLLFSLLIFQRYQLAKESRQKEAFEVVIEAKDKLQVALSHSFAATKMLALLIDKNGQINNFDSIAAQVLETGTDIDAVQMVPGGIIKYVYPLEGNEKALGYNILKDSTRNKEAYKAIEQKSMYFGGPFELKQGGMGVVGRLPVFRQNKFWGFSAAVIKMATLYRVAGIDSSGKDGYYFQLSKVNPSTNKEEFFMPQHKELSHNQVVSVKVPNGEWKLSVYSTVSRRVFADIGLLALLAFLLSVLGSLFAYRFAIKPKKLKELVLNRTSELNASENNYRSVIERVSDAFVALDNNWMYTYVNEKAGELLGREPKTLIGKNVWTEFPEGIDQPFYHAYQRAMETQEYQYMEEYFPTFDKWFENHMYPSKDGLTVFFKDVTDIKQITLALKQKEEKYRTLIEQASDGIVITDMEGVVLEVNKSMQEMIGFSDEEIIGYHITDFLPEEDMETNPLRIHELMQGKSLLYERRLKKKDGSFLDVEVNSKMASSHTLIGFIRDIAERKKYENTLIYQASLLESVSDAVTSLDMERRIVSWNSACEELYGFKTNEVIGKRVPELVTFEYPSTTNEAVFKQVFAEGKWKGEFNFIHPQTKEKIYLLSNINLLKDKNGIINGFILTSKNITDRIKREEEIRISNERFELIAQATNDAIWDHDLIKNETWGNKNLYNIYGLEYGKEKINFEMFLQHIDPAEQAGIQERMKVSIEKKDVSLSETFHFRNSFGEYKTFYDRAYIKYDESGNPLRILGAMQDISENEAAQKAIVEKEKKLEQVLSSSVDNFYVVDVNYTVILINKVAERNMEIAWGKPVKQGANLLELIPEEADEPIKENFKKAFAGESMEYEVKSTRPGLPAWVAVRFTPVYDESEKVTGVSVVARDISERKQAEEILGDSERFLKETQLIAQLGTYTLDIPTGKWESSGILNDIFGIEPNYEKNVENWENIVHPEWREIMSTYFREEVIGKKQRFDKEYKIVRKNDHAERWVHGIGTLKFDEHGQPVTMLGTIQDVSTSKQAEEKILQSEQKYRLLFYNNPLPMWMTTIPGMDFIDVNESAIKQYGYTREEFLKMNTTDLRPVDDIPEFLQEMEKMKADEINTRSWRHKKKDGSIIYVETYSHQIMYEGKRVWLGLTQDVTDKHLAEERLQKSYQDIRQLASNLQNIREDERTSIAREIHDELGQQLTGLKMDIYWLSRKINTTDDEIKAKLNESIQLINATVASVRKIATDLRPSILDDLGLIAALEWQGEEFEKRSGTRVKFINEAGDVLLKPDAVSAIFRIYQELLTNVARHANATLVKVVLEKRNNNVFFTLTDDGTGFDLQTISQKKTLGLLGIKERTLILGGTYEFKSSPGEGSETIISIPIM